MPVTKRILQVCRRSPSYYAAVHSLLARTSDTFFLQVMKFVKHKGSARKTVGGVSCVHVSDPAPSTSAPSVVPCTQHLCPGRRSMHPAPLPHPGSRAPCSASPTIVPCPLHLCPGLNTLHPAFLPRTSFHAPSSFDLYFLCFSHHHFPHSLTIRHFSWA